jgi:hypothetical protein
VTPRPSLSGDGRPATVHALEQEACSPQLRDWQHIMYEQFCVGQNYILLICHTMLMIYIVDPLLFYMYLYILPLPCIHILVYSTLTRTFGVSGEVCNRRVPLVHPRLHWKLGGCHRSTLSTHLLSNLPT